MKVSLITTFYNEEDNIISFLESVLTQTRLPDEVILVDGGSIDQTVVKINDFIHKNNKKLPIKIFVKKGNRSVGRNEAVKRARGDIIACSDVGCILDKEWLRKITEPFKKAGTDVVAGYYEGVAKTTFQKSLVPYVLVMPDKVNPNEFLPATRSVAFRKKVWKKLGSFDEKLSHNEDYAFAKNLKEKGAKILFAGEAIAYWIPRTTFKQAFIMFFRFALGDIEAGIYRGKVQLLFLRYFFAIYFFLLSLLYKTLVPIFILICALFAYIIWSIWKNYAYVRTPKAFLYLPAIQFTADIAVMIGSVIGGVKQIKNNVPQTIKNNYLLIIFLLGYILLMMSVIGWGLPGIDHPFTYHMDEWHQLQSVRLTIRDGNPNEPGAAFGPLLQFLLSGLYLIPFILSGIVNPFLIKSTFSHLDMQMRLIEVLRTNTIFFGLVSLIGLFTISKKYLKALPSASVALFLFTPIFLSLSNYFKYDVALLGWEVLGILGVFAFADKPNKGRYFFTGFLCACALATKISALPLILLYFISYFLFTKKEKWEWITPIIGMLFLIAMFLLLGIPNVFFGKGDYAEFLYSNLVASPSDTSNFILGTPYQLYMLTHQFPFLFGYGLAAVSSVSFFYWFIKVFWDSYTRKRLFFKLQIFLLIGILLFSASLSVLGIGGTGNRALVLLPFVVLLTVSFLQEAGKVIRVRRFFPVLVIFLIILQIIQCIPWMTMKWSQDPRKTSSTWIKEHIPPGSTIGIELIPIYQYIPDIALKEYYLSEQHLKTTYTYSVIDENTAKLPKIVIISNADASVRFLKSFPKKKLVQRLQKEHYKTIATFYIDGFLTKFINRRDLFVANLGPTAPIPLISIYSQD